MRYLLSLLLLVLPLFAINLHSNRLAKESSPYLQQHAHNPIHWYPWGEEALEKAKREHKLIFLSIGYSTCHWCHVMEEESFSTQEVANLLNQSYISIKVDREEYPQLDKKYQTLYLKHYGKRGGWPLTIFLSPEGEVFHIATYIPKEAGYGSKGLMEMLPRFSREYQNKNPLFDRAIASYKQEDNISKNTTTQASFTTIFSLLKQIEKAFDAENGGFSTKPKYPEASKMNLLLDSYLLFGTKKYLTMVEKTAQKMARGGIYDQVDGGFFRYTTDSAWQIPHFEKMLYTNAELLSLYVKLFQVTKNPLYKKVVEETISQMESRFLHHGLYWSASDADSEGEEGGYFTYRYTRLKHDLHLQGFTKEEIQEGLAYLGIEEDGNIDGEFSHIHLTSTKYPAKLKEILSYLHRLRLSRTFPFIDKKVITSWNAMMIKSLFVASSIDEKYAKLAKERVETLLQKLSSKKKLYHQYIEGYPLSRRALLEDYAFLIDALLKGYEVTYDSDYLHRAKELTKEAIKSFYRQKRWYLSDDAIEAVSDYDDRYYTSALSVMLENILDLSLLTESLPLYTLVKETLASTSPVEGMGATSCAKKIELQLRLLWGEVVVKSTKQNLMEAKEKIAHLQEPFLLTKAVGENDYLACSLNSCFTYNKNATHFFKRLKEFLDAKREP